MANKPKAPIVLGSTMHHDTRLNIPTEELRDLVSASERDLHTMLYQRDTSLDPQLIWRGKVEQDKEGLQVPVVPIYIQEKIHPLAIIDDLKEKREPQASLFADFNGLPMDFKQRIDFYQHPGHWQNRMILGDSLLVMASLAEKEGLRGKVQCVYIDPPYGIGFGSNWQPSTKKCDVRDGRAEDVCRQPEQIKAFRDTWNLGVNSYLTYLRDRLTLSRDLLTESGSVFVQIGDENVHLVRCLLDEVFRKDNFVSLISFQTTTGFDTNTISSTCDYLLWYAKDKNNIKVKQLYKEQNIIPGQGTAKWILLPDGTYRSVSTAEQLNANLIPEGSIFYKPDDITSQGSASIPQPFIFNGKTYFPSANRHWTANYPEGMRRLAYAKRIHKAKNSLRFMRLATDFPYKELGNVWTDTTTGNFNESKIYVVQTNTKVVGRCLLMSTDPGDLVLDPTCGSGTTAWVAENWGRRWITCDTSRVALALARVRLMSAKFPWYILADSPEGQLEEDKLSMRISSAGKTSNDIRKGFVYERVPHVGLEIIANNPDIKEGMTREEIAAAIARHTNSEILYDQPRESEKAIRVTGPFTVESLSPHRVLSLADDNLDGRVTEEDSARQNDFVLMILEYLKLAGVQNTKKGERLQFNRLDLHSGAWIQAVGEYTDKDGASRTVAVALGPEFGTVGANLVKEAAKEASKGIGFDTLLVCGFAFDPHVYEESVRYGDLTVLPVRMNLDLSIDKELLEKNGVGNLFMIFGEPDLEIRTQKDCRLVAELKGVDIYDPTTGEIRSNSVADVACWFIDTDYNDESFFVRQAYFTGGKEPYKSLRRALKADIDESAWSSLYSHISRPFPRPESGKIAVKVINHYGDEVLKVFHV